MYETIVILNIADQVKCTRFDITSINSGPRNDACTRTCCDVHVAMHHISEIMLETVVVLSLGPSKDPDSDLQKAIVQMGSRTCRSINL